MEQQSDINIRAYLDVARRRWPLLVFPFLLIALVAAAVAVRLPPIYSSTGTIMIESQQIPDELIRTTVTTFADERIQVIQQLVMTRENLLRIIEKYDLMAEIRDQLTVSEQIDLMHQRIQIDTFAGNVMANSSPTTTAFTVSFEDKSPDMAHAVANELVTLFLEENVRSRTARASETTDFLRDEAEKLKRQLEVIEGQIATYKQENSEALPEHLDLHMGMLNRTESQIEDVERDIDAAEDEYRFLEIELSAIRAGVANAPGRPVTLTPEQELRNAESELSRLEARYSQLHPDVKRQQSKIERLRAELSQRAVDGGAEGVDSIQNIDAARVRASMQSVSDRIESLKDQHGRLVRERSELEEVIIQTPQVQRALISLNRDYENLLEKYNEIQSKQMEAKLAESLEEENKAERFLLLEPPVRPDRPVKPNRKKILAMGLAFALAASVGLTLLAENADGRIYSAEALAKVIEQTPLAIIPYITTEQEIAQRKRLHRWFMSGGVAAGLLLVVAVHLFFMPLDLLAVKVMARLG